MTSTKNSSLHLDCRKESAGSFQDLIPRIPTFFYLVKGQDRRVGAIKKMLPWWEQHLFGIYYVVREVV